MTEINDSEQFNKEIRSWANQTHRIIQGKIPRGKTNKYVPPLHSSFRLTIGKMYGEIDRIGYRFSLHGVFIQKGVGRGYISNNGIISRGNKIKISRNLHNKHTDFRTKPGIISRRPNDWFNSNLESRFQFLSNIVVENYADRVISLFEKAKIK